MSIVTTTLTSLLTGHPWSTNFRPNYPLTRSTFDSHDFKSPKQCKMFINLPKPFINPPAPKARRRGPLTKTWVEYSILNCGTNICVAVNLEQGPAAGHPGAWLLINQLINNPLCTELCTNARLSDLGTWSRSASRWAQSTVSWRMVDGWMIAGTEAFERWRWRIRS